MASRSLQSLLVASVLLATTSARAGTYIGQTPQDESPGIASLHTLVENINRVWHPLCETEKQRHIKIRVKFQLSSDGRVFNGPSWVDPTDDPDQAYAAQQAIAAVSNGQPYAGLADGLYNTPITIMFDAERACAVR